MKIEEGRAHVNATESEVVVTCTAAGLVTVTCDDCGEGDCRGAWP